MNCFGKYLWYSPSFKQTRSVSVVDLMACELNVSGPNLEVIYPVSKDLPCKLTFLHFWLLLLLFQRFIEEKMQCTCRTSGRPPIWKYSTCTCSVGLPKSFSSMVYDLLPCKFIMNTPAVTSCLFCRICTSNQVLSISSQFGLHVIVKKKYRCL